MSAARRIVATVCRVALGAIFLLIVGCAPGTDGIVITSAAPDDQSANQDYGTEPLVVVLPTIPVVRLPDLSTVGDYDELLKDRLAAFAVQPLEGVEVLTVDCADGQAVYRGDESSDIFTDYDFGRDESFRFAIDPTDGSSTYHRQDRRDRVQMTTNLDGSGHFIEETNRSKLSIEAYADGSGRYFFEDRATTSVDVAADGSGVFYRRDEDSLLTVTLRPDGSGALYSQASGELVTVEAHDDGSGDFYFDDGRRTVTVRARGDGSWELVDSSFGNEVTVSVNADGSGKYRERGSRTIRLDFAADGSSPGPSVLLPAAPHFAVMARFPALGTLATISPPCATVLRFDSALLFEVNEATVITAAAELLAEVAPALIEAGRSIEINGHTDATGSDEYNQALSERRAHAVADELRAHGVEVEMTINGFGESQPVAPNFAADGSDDEAGQRQNRRVELVIHG